METYWEKFTSNRKVNRRRLLGAASSGVAAAALLAACGGDDGDGDTSEITRRGVFSPTEGTPTPGGHLVWNTGTSLNRNFNPVSDWSDANHLEGALVYDRPISTREDSRRYVLEAMESIEVSDPLKVVMKLTPGQTYQNLPPVNGRAVRASDIEATQKYVASLSSAFDKTFVRDYLDRMEVTDDRTITYHLKKPMAYLFGMGFLGSGTGQPIIPTEMLAQDLATSKPVGSGPYIHEEAQLGVSQKYRKNPTFREAKKGLPYIETREWLSLPDPVAYESAFRAGRLDWILGATPNVANSVEKDMAASGRARVYRIEGKDDNAIRWNMIKPENPWRTDPRIREAILRLTNRQQILELTQSNSGVIPYGLVPAAMKEFWPDRKFVDPFLVEDVAKAKQLLSAANWDPNKEVVLIVNTAVQDIMAVYQQQLERGGIKAIVQTYTGTGQFFQRLTEGTWDAFTDAAPSSGDPYASIRAQHSDSWSGVYRGFALYDKEIDALIERSEATVDADENLKLVKEIQVKCMEKHTLSFLTYTLNSNYLLQNRLQNFELSLSLPNARHDAWMKSA